MYEKEETNQKTIKIGYDTWFCLKTLQERLRMERVNMTMNEILCALILKDPDIQVYKIVLEHFDPNLRTLLYPQETMRF